MLRISSRLALATLIILFCSSNNSVAQNCVGSEVVPDNFYRNVPIATQEEFFRLLDYDNIAALASVEAAVDSVPSNYVGAKSALLDYMRNRAALWGQHMPGATPPRYYFDPQSERRKLLAEADIGANGEIGVADADLEHVFNIPTCDTTCDFGSDIDWLVDTSLNPNCVGNTADPACYLHELNRWTWVPNLTWVYLKTRNEKYARELIDRILVDWAHQVPAQTFPVAGNTPWAPLDVGIRAKILLDAYYVLLTSPSLTPDKHFVIVRLILDHASVLHSFAKYQGYLPGNHGQAVAGSLPLFGLMFPEFKDTVLEADFPNQCSVSRTVRGARSWLVTGLQLLEAHLLTGGAGLGQPNDHPEACDSLNPYYATMCCLPDVSAEGWSNEYSADYHGSNVARLLEAQELLDLNEVWTDPILSNAAYFNLSQGPLARGIPQRIRRMADVLYRYKGPDNYILSAGDSVLQTRAHILGRATVSFADADWKARADRPHVKDVGLAGVGVFDSIQSRPALFSSFRDPIADFFVARSDAENTIANDSQLLFFDANSNAYWTHAHEDVGQVRYFAFGHHVLTDPGRRSQYGVPNPKTRMDFHSVSAPDGYLLPNVYRVNKQIQVEAEVLEFTDTHGFQFSKAAIGIGIPIVTRSVLYLRPEYAVVVDRYTDQTPVSPNTAAATTYWHFGYRAAQNAENATCDNPSQAQSTVTVDTATKVALARYYDPNDGFTASLYIVPHHPSELTTGNAYQLLDGCEAGYGGDFSTERATKRLLYHFNRLDSPTREQILFPQSAEDVAIVPELVALDPDNDAEGARGLLASGMQLDFVGDDRVDVILMNHELAASEVTFGGDFSTDADVAYVQYGTDAVVDRVMVKNGTTLSDPGGLLFRTEGASARIQDIDLEFAGTTLNIWSSPNHHVITVYAPAVVSVNYNGVVVTNFVRTGDEITLDLDRTASRLIVAPTEEQRLWLGAVGSVRVDAVGPDGVVDSDFNGTIQLTANPQSVEFSLDDFITVAANSIQVPLIAGSRSVSLRGIADNSGNPVTVTASYSGLTSGIKNNLFVDSLDTVGWEGVTTTLDPTTTSTSTTTTSSTTTTTMPCVVQIFADAFESGGFTAGGWVNSDAQAWTTDTYAGNYSARFNNADVLTKSLNLLGYANVSVTYARMTKQCEATDHFKVEWYNGTAWSTLEDLTSDHAWTLKTYNLPASANHNPNFQLRMKTVNNGALDLAFLDAVSVTGEAQGLETCGNLSVDGTCTAGLVGVLCSTNTDCDGVPGVGRCSVMEECDHGNEIDGDGCSWICQREGKCRLYLNECSTNSDCAFQMPCDCATAVPCVGP